MKLQDQRKIWTNQEDAWDETDASYSHNDQTINESYTYTETIISIKCLDSDESLCDTAFEFPTICPGKLKM